MAHIIMRSGNKPLSPEGEFKLSALADDVHSIEAHGAEDRCVVCGAHGPLTDGHVPAKAALNISRADAYTIEETQNGDVRQFRWNVRKEQGGVSFRSVCGPCNSRLGGQAEPEYVKFTRQCSNVTKGDSRAPFVEINSNLRWARLAKAAIFYIVSAAQPGFTEKYQDVREYLVSSDSVMANDRIHLHCFAVATRGFSWSTGFCVYFNQETEAGCVYAEGAHWPLGWFLTIGEAKPEWGCEITNFCKMGYKQKEQRKLVLPRHDMVTPPPVRFTPR